MSKLLSFDIIMSVTVKLFIHLKYHQIKSKKTFKYIWCDTILNKKISLYSVYIKDTCFIKTKTAQCLTHKIENMADTDSFVNWDIKIKVKVGKTNDCVIAVVCKFSRVYYHVPNSEWLGTFHINYLPETRKGLVASYKFSNDLRGLVLSLGSRWMGDRFLHNNPYVLRKTRQLVPVVIRMYAMTVIAGVSISKSFTTCLFLEYQRLPVNGWQTTDGSRSGEMIPLCEPTSI